MAAESIRVCGRELSATDIERVREVIREASPPLRSEVARRVCEAFDWSDALGRPQLMSARVALLRLHRAGWIELPPPRNGNGQITYSHSAITPVIAISLPISLPRGWTRSGRPDPMRATDWVERGSGAWQQRASGSVGES